METTISITPNHYIWYYFYREMYFKLQCRALRTHFPVPHSSWQHELPLLIKHSFIPTNIYWISIFVPDIAVGARHSYECHSFPRCSEVRHRSAVPHWPTSWRKGHPTVSSKITGMLHRSGSINTPECRNVDSQNINFLTLTMFNSTLLFIYFSTSSCWSSNGLERNHQDKKYSPFFTWQRRSWEAHWV